MKIFLKTYLATFMIAFMIVNVSAQEKKSGVAISDAKVERKKRKKKKYKLPNIDLSHWKVTIPEGEGKGGAVSVKPPEILEYANNETLKPYMYNDSTSGALVFYAYPSNATTANTKYSRSELREQMQPGNDNANWTFKDGGYLKAKMAMGEVTRDKKGKHHRVIVAQIHGRLTNEQRDLIGQKDNNAPPILKIYWDKGKIRVKTKVLKFAGVGPKGILYKEAWTDDKGRNFEEEVGFRKFTIEVKVTEGKMVVSLNKNEFFVYDSPSIKRWGIFENYFKVGNYLQTRDEGAFAKVKLYELSVTH
ncbi:polysaccharide lyase family 7 protein [Flagellimonas nanhaiensis]|uniref:Polysaccharide lyase family 7 protein n=1 Tax=Flagellimonas nanhaiensis TaxID=2292706 RepID=A0A371JRQ6_9FLAO|nr:polysaccharide lyase family 7 protein [Allomuricauda nanhaiensis]RDY60191.1 polysaccharide lyase family 7 protein [Allomuricauda nanhaiensis]